MVVRENKRVPWLMALKGDVVTLALANDINEIVKSGQINPGWEKEFPNNSAPYTSTVVFLVRKGNPKGIKDWTDLTKPGVQIITPNPKTGGLPRWIYLSAWGYALKQPVGVMMLKHVSLFLRCTIT